MLVDNLLRCFGSHARRLLHFSRRQCLSVWVSADLIQQGLNVVRLNLFFGDTYIFYILGVHVRPLQNEITIFPDAVSNRSLDGINLCRRYTCFGHSYVQCSSTPFICETCTNSASVVQETYPNIWLVFSDES